MTKHGRDLIKEMMKRGIIIDIDHMSYKSLNGILNIAEGYEYPVVAGHTAFNDLALRKEETGNIHNCSNEYKRILKQMERIRKLNGVIAIGLSQGDVAREPEDQFYGDRSAGVNDQFGNKWWIATHKEDLSKEEITKRMDEAMKQQNQDQH